MALSLPDLPVWMDNPYAQAFLVLLVFFVVFKVIYNIVVKILRKVASKTATQVDDLIIDGVNKPVSLIILLCGAYFATLPFQQTFAYFWVVENILASLGVIIITYIVALIVDILIENWGRKFAEQTESDFDDQLVGLAHRFSRVTIFLIGIMFVLPVWGVQIGPLLASLGVAGIAIAFALQSTLGNIFGGISLIVDKSIKVGDVIQLDPQTSGTVIDVGLRSTRIRTWDNELIIVPNGKVADAQVTNFIQPDPKVRVVVLFGTEYGSDTQQVKDTIVPILKNHEKTLDDPAPNVVMLSMGDFALNFRATAWVKSFDDKFMTKCELTEQIYDALNKAGIGIPFPTRTVHMKKE